jgi:predicted O-methyltransferase YrrM
MKTTLLLLLALTLAWPAWAEDTEAQKKSDAQKELDERVEKFLEEHEDQWRDRNIPASDGQVLFDLIVENGFTRAVEIGTSTGHSAIWMAWALSRTGGKLVTIEIDEGRYKKALANFEEAGLSDYIDARLADAHELVYELEGPIDFVFVDADKSWYTRYFLALHPKMAVGGCYTAHNVVNVKSEAMKEFLDTLDNTPGLETEIVRASRSGISVSYKKPPEQEPDQTESRD